jgi:hypothetical protein
MADARELTSILRALLTGRVEFILVGALAAVAQGAPITTHDVDIVHARTQDNLDRLLAVLSKLNARCLGRPVESRLPPDRAALATTGRSLFVTDLGPLDCLGAIEGGRGYEELVPLAVELELEGGACRVLGLETIVAIKRESGATKDRLMLPVLEETLARVLARGP